MATAFLFPLANLFARLQAFADWLAARPQPVPCAATHRPAHRVAIARPARPLRVVRVLEPSAPRADHNCHATARVSAAITARRHASDRATATRLAAIRQ